MRDNGEGYAKPKVIEKFMWNLGQKSNDDAGDTKMRGYEMGESMMNTISNEH